MAAPHHHDTHHARNDHHAAHVHGTMDTLPQEKTFNGFVRFATWNVVAIIVVLIFLALANA